MGNQELHKGAPPVSFFFAKENRKKQTTAEELLWNHLRDRRLDGFKFRRQHPIHDFIADFYCFKKQLIIEIDGDYHNQEIHSEYDKGRTSELNELQITILRFTNTEVLDDTDSVLDTIRAFLTGKPPQQSNKSVPSDQTR